MMCGLTKGSLEWRFTGIFYGELQFRRCYEDKDYVSRYVYVNVKYYILLDLGSSPQTLDSACILNLVEVYFAFFKLSFYFNFRLNYSLVDFSLLGNNLVNLCLWLFLGDIFKDEILDSGGLLANTLGR